MNTYFRYLIIFLNSKEKDKSVYEKEQVILVNNYV